MSVRLCRLILLLTTVLCGMGEVALAAQKVRRNVEVEWDTVDSATMYEVQVTRKDVSGKKPQRFKVREPRWEATISPGLYSMQVRSFDDRGAPGDWSPPSDLRVRLPSVVQEEPTAGARLNARDQEREAIRFKWDEVPGAAKYKLKVHSLNSDFVEEREVDVPSAEVQAPVGQDLAWNVTAIDPNGEPGEVNPNDESFQFLGPSLPTPEIKKPLSRYVSEIQWETPPHAQAYSYELYYRNPQTRNWDKLEAKPSVTDTTLKLDISRPSGRYRLKVQARADLRGNSRVAQLDFETRGGFRDPAALRAAMMRDSITKPTNFYLITSYMVTEIQYVGANYDINHGADFKAVGGTGRVGLGYQNTDSNWGAFAIADLSGFTIAGQNFTFASIEAHVTHRLEFGQNGLLLVGAGLFSKELPIVLGETPVGGSSTQYSGVGKVRDIGPHLGFTYWMPLSRRFGAQLNARAYYTLLGSATTGGKALTSLSYQYGLLGTYRLSKAWMGYCGYAYRKDQGLYATSPSSDNFSSSGEVNSVEIEGNYLNLLLEYSF